MATRAGAAVTHTADNTDRQENAMPCTCPPKTNNQKDPTILQVEFTPAYLLGAWQEDPDCPRHGEQSSSVGGTTTSSEEQH